MIEVRPHLGVVRGPQLFVLVGVLHVVAGLATLGTMLAVHLEETNRLVVHEGYRPIGRLLDLHHADRFGTSDRRL